MLTLEQCPRCQRYVVPVLRIRLLGAVRAVCPHCTGPMLPNRRLVPDAAPEKRAGGGHG